MPTRVGRAVAVGRRKQQDDDAPSALDLALALPGLYGRWVATEGVTESSSLVSAWAPTHGTAADLTASGTARPTYNASSTPSGNAALEFDGSANLLQFASDTNWPDDTTYALYWAGTLDELKTGIRSSFGFLHLRAGGRDLIDVRTTTVGASYGFFGGSTVTAATLDPSTFGVWSANLEGANSYGKAPGIAESGALNPGTGWAGIGAGYTGFVIGGQRPSGGRSKLKVSEVLVYINATHDAGQRSLVRSHLSGWS